jgi:hypothetical protein
MNRKQEMIKKLAKRAKARSNKVDPANPTKNPKPKYISKAERTKLDQEQANQVDGAEAVQILEKNQDK